MRTTFCLMLLACAAPLAGCGPDETIYATDARKATGMVVILPGIEGESDMNRGIREGIMNAGVEYALVIRSWGVPVPGVGMVINQTNFLGNRMAGAGVARMIVEYQNANPGKPVYVVGHSGGGGVAVFTAEALAEMEGDHRVDGLVLLDASVSANYDLSKALSRSRNGLANFYNVHDSLLLGGGTALLGNVDGGHGASAGLGGFTREFPRLFQVSVDSADSVDDPHAAATKPYYVASNVVPWIRAKTWPPGAARQ